SVAPRYDLMNDLMSAGMHRIWKDAFVTALAPPRAPRRPYRVLDVAGRIEGRAHARTARSRNRPPRARPGA
ncbi:MAG: class I SAM-dependent methyltransferase, partial [Rhizobiales bacterium]|nr:class I SAM-dependent methyltransferase [Hyphomicrobiales bacterium]